LSESLVQQALVLSLQTVDHLAHGRSVPEFPQRLAELRALVRREALGPSTAAIVNAARQRGIPVLRLADASSLFQLGWGARAQRVRATITGRTGHVAVDIASDKHLTKRLLSEAGIAVPRGEIVQTVQGALAVMQRLGLALAVKPLDANQGKGVTVNVQGEEALRAAFARAAEWSRRVIVEEFIEGDDHRVLVVGDRVVAASRRHPPSVTGDGSRTVRQLVEAENGNPLRGDGHATPLSRIPLDAGALEALAKQGLDFDSVPPEGTLVYLRGNANLSTGGTAEDVTDRLHPETASACVRAARAIGLDVAGIDLMCVDIGRALHAQRGAIIEINAAPGIRMHEHPSSGIARRAGEAIVDSLFEQRSDGRIPIIAVTGTNGKTTTTLAIGSILRHAGYRTGVTTTEGVYIEEQVIARGDYTGYWSARMVLTSPDVDAAVLETARGGILRRGLAFDGADVGVVLNVQADHLGMDGVDSLEDLAWAKGLIARTARKAAVLNAEDGHCVRMAGDLKEGVEVVYFSMDAANPTVARHLGSGGRAVVLRNSAIVLAERERRTPVVDVQRLPFTLNGLARHNVANALACAAAAWAAGISREKICEGLTNFHASREENPLRLNLYRHRPTGAMVVVDYAHNPSAYDAMIATGRNLTAGRLIGVVAAPGDRRDDELLAVGQACRGFDELVVYEMDDRRGRSAGATASVIARAAVDAGMPPQRLHVEPQIVPALRAGLSLCRAGDVLVYGCASFLGDLEKAIPEGLEEMRVVERRRAHLAPYADGRSVDMPTASRPPSGWDASLPDRRHSQPGPHIVSATQG
jgi:cyanophycin synthetase